MLIDLQTDRLRQLITELFIQLIQQLTPHIDDLLAAPEAEEDGPLTRACEEGPPDLEGEGVDPEAERAAAVRLCAEIARCAQWRDPVTEPACVASVFLGHDEAQVARARCALSQLPEEGEVACELLDAALSTPELVCPPPPPADGGLPDEGVDAGLDDAGLDAGVDALGADSGVDGG